MPAHTLFHMATITAIRNVKHIEDFGDMPWDMVKNILKKVENPYQLQKIEVNSPQYVEADGELWLAFIERDFPDYHKNKDIAPPNDGVSWNLVYFDILQKEKQKQREQEAELKKNLRDSSKARAENETPFINKIIITPQNPVIRTRGYDPKVYAVVNDGKQTANKRLPTLAKAKNGSQMIAALRRETAARSKRLALAADQKKAVNARQLQRQTHPAAKQPVQAPEPTVVTPKALGRGAAVAKPANMSGKQPAQSSEPNKVIPKAASHGAAVAKPANMPGKSLNELSKALAEQSTPTKKTPQRNKRPTVADLKKQGKDISTAVQQSLSEREANLQAIKAKTPPRPDSPPPPSPIRYTPSRLPFDAVITTTSSPTSGEHITTRIETPLQPVSLGPQPRTNQHKRKAPVSLFMAKKKRMT